MQNVDPDHWAQPLWKSVHWIAAGLPSILTDELKQASASLVSLLCYLIPCETCRDHFIQFVHSVPPHFTSGDDVRTWWFKCHNYVNRMLKKPELGMDQLHKMYSLSPPSHALVPVKPLALSYDINKYMTSGNILNGRWKPSMVKPVITRPMVRTTPFNRVTTQLKTFGNSSLQTIRWRNNLKLKTGAGTGMPPKKPGCKKCGKR